MGVFTRFRDIISANITVILDRAEDPEKMVRLMIQEMEDTMVELKAACAEKMSLQRSAERDLAELDAGIRRWDERVDLALARGREDLAAEALREKRLLEGRRESCEALRKNLGTIVEESRGQIGLLEAKLAEVGQKHRLLIQRGLHARDTRKAWGAMEAASGVDSLRRFDEMERRIQRMEAEAELYSPVSAQKANTETEFSKMEFEDSVAREIEARKQNMSEGGGGKTGPDARNGDKT
ncbi:MAG: PspA/IM30 family protein [Spirochaetia bacterium]|jgi:phage shock protein A|nr:PspA/IM30 family protein [Spirochaetia bacterium]